MKNKFLLGLLALSTLGLANVFEAKAEVNEEVAKGGKVFTATKANQKNKLEVKLNDTLTVTGKLGHDFSDLLKGDTGLSVKADFKEMGSLELNTSLDSKASLGYMYKTDALGLALEANAKYAEEAKFTKNTLEAGLKASKAFDSTLKVEGRTKLQYAIHESKVTPEVGGMVEYKPVEGLVLKTDLNFNTPVMIAKAGTTANFELKFKNFAEYSVMLDSKFKVSPQAELVYTLGGKLAKEPALTHAVDVTPALATEYQMNKVTLNAKAASTVKFNASGYVSVTPKFEAGLKYTW